jgi:hypothetical protein
VRTEMIEWTRAANAANRRIGNPGSQLGGRFARLAKVHSRPGAESGQVEIDPVAGQGSQGAGTASRVG